MIEFGNVNVYINYEVVPSFLKSDTVISTSDYHCRLDVISTRITPAHSAINNSEKGSGNTLLRVVRTTGKNKESAVSECIEPRY